MIESDRDDLGGITQQLKRLNFAPSGDLRRGRARVLAEAAQLGREHWRSGRLVANMPQWQRRALAAIKSGIHRPGLAATYAEATLLTLIILGAALALGAALLRPAPSELATTPTLALTQAPQGATRPVSLDAAIGFTVTPAQSRTPARMEPTPRPALVPEEFRVAPNPAATSSGLRPARVVPTAMHASLQGTVAPDSN